MAYGSTCRGWLASSAAALRGPSADMPRPPLDFHTTSKRQHARRPARCSARAAATVVLAATAAASVTGQDILATQTLYLLIKRHSLLLNCRIVKCSMMKQLQVGIISYGAEFVLLLG